MSRNGKKANLKACSNCKADVKCKQKVPDNCTYSMCKKCCAESGGGNCECPTHKATIPTPPALVVAAVAQARPSAMPNNLALPVIAAPSSLLPVQEPVAPLGTALHPPDLPPCPPAPTLSPALAGPHLTLTSVGRITSKPSPLIPGPGPRTPRQHTSQMKDAWGAQYDAQQRGVEQQRQADSEQLSCQRRVQNQQFAHVWQENDRPPRTKLLQDVQGYLNFDADLLVTLGLRTEKTAAERRTEFRIFEPAIGLWVDVSQGYRAAVIPGRQIFISARDVDETRLPSFDNLLNQMQSQGASATPHARRDIAAERRSVRQQEDARILQSAPSKPERRTFDPQDSSPVLDAVNEDMESLSDTPHRLLPPSPRRRNKKKAVVKERGDGSPA